MLEWLFKVRKTAPTSSGREPGAGAEETVSLIHAALDHHRAGRLPEAESLYRQVLRVDPENIDATHFLGVAAYQAGRLDEAEKLLSQALSRNPGNAPVLNNLGNVLLKQGRMEEAIASFTRAIALQADYVDPCINLAVVWTSRNEFDKAAACYQRAIELRPDFAEAHCNLGHVLRLQGRPEQATSRYERALAVNPNYLEALSGLATALMDLGEFDRAVSTYRDAAALNPGIPEVHSNLGNALRQVGRLNEAIAACRRALALNPEFPAALCNLGTALEGLDKLDEAIGCYRKALEIEPGVAVVHYNLGDALGKAGRHAEALEHFRHALSLNENYHEARWALTMSQLPAAYDVDQRPADYRDAFSRELEELERWFELKGGETGYKAVGVQQPFYLAYQEEDNRALLERFGKICVGVMAKWWQRQGMAPAAKRRAGEVIRVGIVSRHFRGGSIWEAVIEGWFRNLDRRRFALHAFSLGSAHDEQTAVAQSTASQFEEGAGGLRQWVDAIRKAKPDVLIYPEIGIHPLTLKLASLRLAPLQITTWGHPQTTGLSTIDYYLSAEGMEPPNAQEHYTERLALLPNLGCFYYRPADLPPASAQPAGPDFDRDAPILLCPGTPFKYAPEFDWVFPEIALNLKRCRFVFFTYWLGDMSAILRRRLEQVFARRNLAFDEYAVFAPWQSREAFQSLLKRASVYLDTIGYSGFNTAMQAVECGLPIVAREGRFLRGRFGSGILKRIGVPELVAQSGEEYVALAVRLCRDADYRETLRKRIESNRHVAFEDIAPIRALEVFLTEAVRPLR